VSLDKVGCGTDMLENDRLGCAGETLEKDMLDMEMLENDMLLLVVVSLAFFLISRLPSTPSLALASCSTTVVTRNLPKV
jgi:hypothetical protein